MTEKTGSIIFTIIMSSFYFIFGYVFIHFLLFDEFQFGDIVVREKISRYSGDVLSTSEPFVYGWGYLIFEIFMFLIGCSLIIMGFSTLKDEFKS